MIALEEALSRRAREVRGHTERGARARRSRRREEEGITGPAEEDVIGLLDRPIELARPGLAARALIAGRDR